MISLNAIISDYFTIIRDYFSGYFPDYFSDYVGLYTVMLSIIYDCFTASAVDWKARRQNGKLPDGAFLYH
jgi:hypothetical protein